MMFYFFIYNYNYNYNLYSYEFSYDQSTPCEGKWFSNGASFPFFSSFQFASILSSPSQNSLKFAIRPSSSTSSITRSSLATVSTSSDAKAANGSASAKSRLVIVTLLSVGRSDFLSDASLACSAAAAVLDFQRSNADESVFTVEIEAEELNCLAAASAIMLLVALESGPKKSFGWDLRAASRSWSASWRWSERISGEHWRR